MSCPKPKALNPKLSNCGLNSQSSKGTGSRHKGLNPNPKTQAVPGLFKIPLIKPLWPFIVAIRGKMKGRWGGWPWGGRGKPYKL